MKLKLASLLLILCFTIQVKAQNKHTYNPVIDVQHYDFKLLLNDTNDTLKGNATIIVKFRQTASSFSLDLINLTASGNGMVVSEVKENANNVFYTHKQDKLQIELKSASKPEETRSYQIVYKGIPADGLIISKNKFGHRTLFGDNWANRARNWLPCVDHPSDKASVEFEVTAPEHYQVVSNGIKIEESNLENYQKFTHWKEDVPLATKVMTIGMADFAVNIAGKVAGIPISSWIYSEDKEKGFVDYAPATEILPFFIKQIGPYPYLKLANVQSKTKFGGMENAGAIFYSERSVSGKNKIHGLLAHEIAHQWFGNSVTEMNWLHVWLSEGFATYMENEYLGHEFGRDSLIFLLKEQRKKVIDFEKLRFTPVVDSSSVTNYMDLLNANSYEKGGWVLHILQHKIGDDLFWKGIQLYYATYKGKNATTEDLQYIFEQASGLNLSSFFQQWLYTAGTPQLTITWKYNQQKKSIEAIVMQEQTGKPFSFPLDLKIGDTIKTIQISNRVSHISFTVKTKPAEIIIDPNTNLLYSGSVKGN